MTVIGLVVAAAGLLQLSRIGVHTEYGGLLLGGLIVFPVGQGLALAGSTLAALDGVSDTDSGLASGVVSSAAQTGPAVVLALLIAIAGARTAQMRNSGASPAAATTRGYALAFGVTAAVFAAAAALAVVALRTRGRKPSPGQAES